MPWFNTVPDPLAYFNTKPIPVRIFNKLTKVSSDRIKLPEYMFFSREEWRPYCQMTAHEKKMLPGIKAFGGYMKTLNYKEAGKFKVGSNSLFLTTQSKEEKELHIESLNRKKLVLLMEDSGKTRKMVFSKTFN